MKAFEKRARSAFATLLSAALIVSGAVFAAPAAYAEDEVPAVAPVTEVVEAAAETTVAPEEQPVTVPLEESPEGADGDSAPNGEQPEGDKQGQEDGSAEQSSPDESSIHSPLAASKKMRSLAAASAAPVLLSVSKTAGLNPEGETVTVTGSGYNPDQAIYVFLCGDVALPADLWSVALGCTAGSKVVYPPGSVDRDNNPRPYQFATDGSFSVEFDVKQLNDADTSVFTAANHTGMTDRTQDAKVELRFAAPVVGPQISVQVTEVPNSKISVGVTGSGFDDVKLLFGQPNRHVYAALIEKGSDLSKVDTSSVPNVSIDVNDDHTLGDFSKPFEQVVSELDPSKQYEVILWPSRSNPSAVNLYAAADVVIDWDALLPVDGKPVVSIQSVSVVSNGVEVSVKATGLPGGIYAAIIERGAEADVSTDGGYVAFAQPFPTVKDGAATFTFTAQKANLNRSKQYEVVVWKAHSAISGDTLYARADVNVTDAQWDALDGINPAPKPTPAPAPAPVSPVAGSLTWGVSSGFHDYTTDRARPAKGEVRTSGVGGGAGGYVFPQATGSSWNAETRTGTVRYSGSVTFWGHGGAMNTTFANPVITVNSPISGSITANGTTYVLGLASAGFTANADGSITWSNVPVLGGVSGGGNGGGGGFGMDNLTFTVGVASAANYGSTVTTSPAAQTRTPAAAAPASTGITVVTPPQQLAAGGEIEITASGFQPNETGILVVIYSEPTVLDTNAKADANGVVRWIGTLPEGLTGKHTITMQGSINVGQEITIVAADETKAAGKSATVTETAETAAGVATPISDAGTPAWVWWTGALALLLVAGVSTGLVVAQRRKAEHAATEL